MLTPARFRTLLLGGVALGAVPFAQAYAQAPQPETELEAVVVTAQRRTESLQDVPLSITSVTGAALENSNFRSVTDLQYLVPGVQFDPTNGQALQIRGVGTTSFDLSFAKSVNVVVDDVVMDALRDNGMVGLTDIEQIDVLMGPQGTLFGKNSTSGVVVITTAKPVIGEFSAKADVSYGQRDDRLASLTLNAPISEQLALRVSAFGQGQDGYGRYTVLDQPLNSYREYGVRARLLFRPTERAEFVYAGEYTDHWDNQNRTTVSGGSPAFTAIQIAHGVTPSPTNDDSADDKIGGYEATVHGHSLRAEFQIGRDTLTSITAYRETTYDVAGPANFAPTDEFAFAPYNFSDLSSSKVSQELRWTSPTGGFFEYVGGLFYNRLKTNTDALQWVTFGAPLVSPTGERLSSLISTTGALGTNSNATLTEAKNITAAAFGQVKFNFTPRLSLSLGGRYTRDNNSQSIAFYYRDPLPLTGVPTTFTQTSKAPLQSFGRVKGDNFSYRISGQYNPSEEVMVYATYSTGYKPGGAAFFANNYAPYEDETVRSIEAGAKAELFERRLRVNVNLFRSKFTDFQTSLLTFIPGTTLPVIASGNAGGMRSQGVETTLAWRVNPELTLNGALSYVDAAYTDFQYDATTNYKGTALSYAPKVQAAIGATFDKELADRLRLRASIDYAYRSSAFTTIGEPANVKIPGFGIANGRISVAPVGENFEIGIYGRNLFDKYFSTAIQQYSTLSLTHYTTRDAHRTLGIFVRSAF